MPMRRIAAFVLVTAALTASTAGAFPVHDWLTTLEHRILKGWQESIVGVLSDQVRQIQNMARRLSVFTDLRKYAADDVPRWRVGGISDGLASTDAYIRALSGGDANGTAYDGLARRRAAAGDVLAGLGEDEFNTDEVIWSELATLDLADSTIISGIHQTGQIRGNRRSERNAIAALEQDVVDPSNEQSTTAVLDKVSAASLIRARQQQARLQLLAALNEQLLVDAKRLRDTEVAAMNMHLRRLVDGRASAARFLAGAERDLRTWRQP
jgi:hypothetical protein